MSSPYSDARRDRGGSGLVTAWGNRHVRVSTAAATTGNLVRYDETGGQSSSTSHEAAQLGHLELLVSLIDLVT